MKIAHLEVFVLGFPFKSVFVLAGGVAAARTSSRTASCREAHYRVGRRRLGEATPTPRWTYETTETIVSTLRRYLAPAVAGIECGTSTRCTARWTAPSAPA
jgi:muconate cycloisomerase